MEINSLASGVSILQNADQRVQQAASDIATATTKGNGSSADLVTPVVELKVAAQQAEAGAKVIEVEGRRVGTLLNLLA